MFIKYRIRNIAKNILPNWFYNFIINIYRICKFLFSHSANSAELERLHDIALTLTKLDNNQILDFNQKYSKPLDQKSKIKLHERQYLSGNSEDGVLLYLFDLIGSKKKTFVEFGGGGKSSNSLNLVVFHGWSGLLIDGSKTDLEKNRNLLNTLAPNNNVKYLNAWITEENINDLIGGVFKGEIDFLSIDIDGNDYYIWKAINVIQPRIVCIEYNGSLGMKSLSVPYNKSFTASRLHPLSWYHGASLPALVKLANQKNYSLVYCDSMGVNAFFVRNDCLNEQLKSLPTTEAFVENARRKNYLPHEQQWENLKQYPFTEI